jgi:transposase
MPAPIPVPVRQAILARWQKGESVASLAEALQLSPRTVRHLVRRFADRGQKGIVPDYDRCATKKVPTDDATFQQVINMRQQHPTWGGGLIRVVLQEEGNDGCPSERTLQRWFQRSRTPPAPPGRRPASDEPRARHPHDVWQMDAVDQLYSPRGEMTQLALAANDDKWARYERIRGCRRRSSAKAPGVVLPRCTDASIHLH